MDEISQINLPPSTTHLPQLLSFFLRPLPPTSAYTAPPRSPLFTTTLSPSLHPTPPFKLCCPSSPAPLFNPLNATSVRPIPSSRHSLHLPPTFSIPPFPFLSPPTFQTSLPLQFHSTQHLIFHSTAPPTLPPSVLLSHRRPPISETSVSSNNNNNPLNASIHLLHSTPSFNSHLLAPLLHHQKSPQPPSPFSTTTPFSTSQPPLLPSTHFNTTELLSPTASTIPIHCSNTLSPSPLLPSTIPSTTSPTNKPITPQITAPSSSHPPPSSSDQPHRYKSQLPLQPASSNHQTTTAPFHPHNT